MSAINNSKNRKKKNNKKKNKKQGGTPVDSTTPSEISSPALTDSENLIVEESATASALPAPPIEPVEDGASTPTSKIPAGGPVGVGAAGAGVTAAAVAVAARKSISHAPASLPEPLPLSDNVKHCIKTVVASGSIDTLSIVKTIVKNVEAGDYKAKAALPPNVKAAPVIATPPKDTPPKAANQPTTNETSKSDTVKKAVAGAGAAVAGAGAAVAGAVKGNKGGDKGGENVAVGSDKSKLSENVQHCIQSVVQAPSVNVYGILDAANPNKVSLPEPAVGGSTQPTMPSSAKTADAAAPVTAVPPKTNEAQPKKSKENRKSGLAALKKKNCIIL